MRPPALRPPHIPVSRGESAIVAGAGKESEGLQVKEEAKKGEVKRRRMEDRHRAYGEWGRDNVCVANLSQVCVANLSSLSQVCMANLSSLSQVCVANLSWLSPVCVANLSSLSPGRTDCQATAYHKPAQS